MNATDATFRTFPAPSTVLAGLPKGEMLTLIKAYRRETRAPLAVCVAAARMFVAGGILSEMAIAG